MSSGGGHNLGFRIAPYTNLGGTYIAVLPDDELTTRPATPEERAMWLLLEHAETAIQAAEELREHYAEQDDGKLKGGPLAQQMLGDPLLDALDAYRLAAFRADKEGNGG